MASGPLPAELPEFCQVPLELSFRLGGIVETSSNWPERCPLSLLSDLSNFAPLGQIRNTASKGNAGA